MRPPPLPLITPANVVLAVDVFVKVLAPRLTLLEEELLVKLLMLLLPAVISKVAVPARVTPLDAEITPVLPNANVPAVAIVGFSTVKPCDVAREDFVRWLLYETTKDERYIVCYDGVRIEKQALEFGRVFDHMEEHKDDPDMRINEETYGKNHFCENRGIKTAAAKNIRQFWKCEGGQEEHDHDG